MQDIYAPSFHPRPPYSSSPCYSPNDSPPEDSPSVPLKMHEQQPLPHKSESKPQATFLTKLYALLERPENHHMIRWDPAGEHIIVERPEQLALHVLPTVYRQSRFASFSRQLNIYGFMRKVNLRNVDPAIDDPDASTWSHPTLNRHSPPEVVANFKRRVPPRLPKPRKRESQETPTIPPPRSAIGVAPVPLSVPPPIGARNGSFTGRARGFSAPGSFTPLSQGGAAGWGTSYPRAALPPLAVPPTLSHQNLYGQSISPAEESPSTQFSAMAPGTGYATNQVTTSQYSYPEPSWSFSPNSSASSHSGSLSSLLNPPASNGFSTRPNPTINTSYTSYPAMPMHSDHTPPSLSPDTHSRPTTGYSISSVSSLPYEESPHHAYPHGEFSRKTSPTSRPSSSSKQYGPGSLSIRRPRRHSQAISPYPSPYDHHASERRSPSPQPADDHNVSMSRVRSVTQLSSVDPYGFPSAHADFAYSAVDSMDCRGGWGHHAQAGQRPSTSASSISGASHTSSSQANTPPLNDGYAETSINRCSLNQSHLTLESCH
ncbi:HSF-type DNA-binding-domain-containing protein [Pisolithus orientalis]|uniref:HSF-type DNA-binding-domain-containing protein n=1 Tax=Pisolithus orientalis TaxID=936130 RepID=UPI002224F41D|nr:HSF-type DNA-binding-domain-containing protein [Pisolithus orientalis]KAI6035197.1 HSF-type DNA-binding-domain-containing protein [Pisolithus orientalis]